MGFGRGKGFSPVIPPPTEPTPGVQTSDCPLTHDTDIGFCQYWNANSQTFKPDHTYVATGLALPLTRVTTTTKGLLVVKLELPATSCWEAEVLWSQIIHSTSLPESGDYRWISFSLPDITLSPDTIYRITVHCLPGWVEWDGEEWVPNAAAGDLYWRTKSGTNPYARGTLCSGCNYRDESGFWTPAATDDFAFCISGVIDPDLKSIDVEVGAGNDDCTTYGTTMELDRNYLRLDYSAADYHVYARFLSISIPPGATIISAFIDLKSYSTYTGTSNLRIVGIKEPNTATFSTQADADGRAITDAYKDWTPGKWTSVDWYGYSNDMQNIKAIIQEIIDQGAWAADNALALKITNTSRGITRYAHSQEHLFPIHLYIEYKE